MAQLSGYGAETQQERAEREARERVYGPTPRSEAATSKTDSKEKR